MVSLTAVVLGMELGVSGDRMRVGCALPCSPARSAKNEIDGGSRDARGGSSEFAFEGLLCIESDSCPGVSTLEGGHRIVELLFARATVGIRLVMEEATGESGSMLSGNSR
jgi:hypothetical protein